MACILCDFSITYVGVDKYLLFIFMVQMKHRWSANPYSSLANSVNTKNHISSLATRVKITLHHVETINSIDNVAHEES